MPLLRVYRSPGSEGGNPQPAPTNPNPDSNLTPQENTRVDLSALNGQLAEIQKQLNNEKAARATVENKLSEMLTAKKAEAAANAIKAAAIERNAHSPAIISSLIGSIETDEQGNPKPDVLKAALDKLQADSPFLFKAGNLSADAAATGGGNAGGTLEAQIAAAEQKGDHATARRLKIQKLAILHK